MKTWDVIIVGGGIIGLSLAIALRKRGASVLVVERGEPGREASYAAGGMLVTASSAKGDSHHWEMHPNGDEALVLLEGEARVVFERPTGDEVHALLEGARVGV